MVFNKCKYIILIVLGFFVLIYFCGGLCFQGHYVEPSQVSCDNHNV